MKTYQSHKRVSAAKIVNIVGRCAASPLGVTLHFEGGSHAIVSDEYVQKHKPECGGYFVQYGDGYQSFSPAKAFEEGYTEVSQAPAVLPNKVTREALMAKIKKTDFVLMPDGRTTICQLTMQNGFTIRGESACVDIANFNKDDGEMYARDSAIENAWAFEGYLLAERIHQTKAASLSIASLRNMVDQLRENSERARIDAIARVCHEVNRAYCQALGDNSQPAWEDAPEWQRVSARMGVDLHLSGDFGPEASHISWMEQKRAEGWKYGPVKNPETKEHPCYVPYDQLPREQQAKDYIFRAVVHALK